MTNVSAGQTKTQDPRGDWRTGKSYKALTNRYIRRVAKVVIRTDEHYAGR